MRISDWSSDVCSSDLAFEINARASLSPCLFFGFGDEDTTVIGVPRRNPVAPPKLARDAPGLDILHPVEKGLFPGFGDDVTPHVPDRLHRRLGEGIGVDTPLGGAPGLDHTAPGGPRGGEN